MGAAHFDVEEFGADFAYTLDGDTEGEIQYENFNAAKAEFRISGVNVSSGLRQRYYGKCFSCCHGDQLYAASGRNAPGYRRI